MALQKLCVKRIAESIDLYSSAYSSVESENLKRGFYLLQKIFSDELISYLISKRLLREQHANLVFNEYLKSIDTEWFATYSWSKIVEIFQRIGPNLQKIIFDKSYHDRNSDSVKWQNLICYLHTVKDITYKRLCNNSILKCITEFCPALEILDVTGSRYVTDHGVKFFCEKKKGRKRDNGGECVAQEMGLPCPLLKVMRLNGTSLPLDGVEQLLRNLPSLERIDYGRLPHVLFKMYSDNLSSCNETNSLTYLCVGQEKPGEDYNALLEACVNLCPKLKSLTCPIYSLAHLNFCSTLPDVASLELTLDLGEETRSDAFRDFFKKQGEKMEALTFHKCPVPLSVLLQCCSRLNKLKLDSVTFQYNENESLPILYDLKKIKVKRIDISPSGKNFKGICRILRSAEVLEILTFALCTISEAELKAEIYKGSKERTLKLVMFENCLWL